MKRLLLVSFFAGSLVLTGCGEDDVVTAPEEEQAGEVITDEQATDSEQATEFTFTHFDLDVDYEQNQSLEIDYEYERNKMEAEVENDLTNESLTGR